jgi:hypothetical protein
MTMSDGSEISGCAIKAWGKKTTITIDSGHFDGTVTAVRVMGRPDATHPELARRVFVSSLLSVDLKKRPLRECPFIQMMWFPSEPNPVQPGDKEDSAMIPPITSILNQSQVQVVNAMISPCQRVVIAHGRCLDHVHHCRCVYCYYRPARYREDIDHIYRCTKLE